MKTNKLAAQVITNKSVQIKATRARARARDKAKQGTNQARLAARDAVACAPLAGRGALVVPVASRHPQDMSGEELRAARAGVLTLREVETLQSTAARDAAATAARMELLQARADWRAADCSAHVQAWQAIQDAREDAARARRYGAARESGAWGAVAMSALGESIPRGAREAMDKLREESARIIGDGWHAAEAEDAKDKLARMRAAEVRAGALRLLAMGLPGRVHARACRLARAGAARFMRLNSTREAANRLEIGGAAGVDDLGAFQDWRDEILSIYRDAYLTAAARGLRAVQWIQAREARGLSPRGAARVAMLGIFGRGVRVGGYRDANGRQCRGELVGRGDSWRRAAGIAKDDAERAKYRKNGRDGREVAANWSASGKVRGEDCGAVHREGETIARGVTRRPSLVKAARRALAANLGAARSLVHQAREDARAAVTPQERAAAGGKIGAARTGLAAARAAARNLGAALVGNDLDPAALVRWIDENRTMTQTGEKFAQRFRDSNQKHSCVARPPRRKAPSVAGDELASAPLNLIPSLA